MNKRYNLPDFSMSLSTAPPPKQRTIPPSQMYKKRFRIIIIICVFLAVIASAIILFLQLYDHGPRVIKSEHDEREYRAFSLPNTARILVVSDPGCITFGASVNVAAGSSADMYYYPGTAHFLEHLLFMGTGKYPGMRMVDEAMSASGGFASAYTAHDATNYYFKVSDNLELMLEIFAQFFFNATLTQVAIDLEVSAVESEYRKSLPNDNWAIIQLVKSLAHQRSEFSG